MCVCACVYIGYIDERRGNASQGPKADSVGNGGLEEAARMSDTVDGVGAERRLRPSTGRPTEM